MRTIIAGCRTCNDAEELTKAMAACGWIPTVIINGGAEGTDALGEAWADQRGMPCEKYPADWKRYGRGAGPRRNKQMAEVAEALVALWDGESRGTKHMIDTATRKGLRVHIHLIGQHNRG